MTGNEIVAGENNQLIGLEGRRYAAQRVRRVGEGGKGCSQGKKDSAGKKESWISVSRSELDIRERIVNATRSKA